MPLMRNGSLALAALSAGLLSFSLPAGADEVTTTTRTTREGPPSGVVIGVPGVVGVEVGRSAADECATRRVTRTDDMTGERVTRERTNCR